MTYPILEYDATPVAFIEPAKVNRPRSAPEQCVICFFREVIEKVAAEQQARIVVPNAWEDGPHPLYEIAYREQRLAFFHPGVGAPLAAGLLEEVIAFGCRRFIACGGCGVLERDVAVGHFIVVSGAVRDEGVSYHYLPPSSEIAAPAAGVQALVSTLSQHGIPHLVGKTCEATKRDRHVGHQASDASSHAHMRSRLDHYCWTRVFVLMETRYPIQTAHGARSGVFLVVRSA